MTKINMNMKTTMLNNIMSSDDVNLMTLIPFCPTKDILNVFNEIKTIINKSKGKTIFITVSTR